MTFIVKQSLLRTFGNNLFDILQCFSVSFHFLL